MTVLEAKSPRLSLVAWIDSLVAMVMLTASVYLLNSRGFEARQRPRPKRQLVCV